MFTSLVGVPVVRHVANGKSHVEVADLLNRSLVDRLVYVRKIPYSARFYTHGRAELIPEFDIQALEPIVDAPGIAGIAIEKSYRALLPESLNARLRPVLTIERYIVLVEDAQSNST